MTDSKNPRCLGFAFLAFVFGLLLYKSLTLWAQVSFDQFGFWLVLGATQFLIFKSLKKNTARLVVSLGFYFLLGLAFWLNNFLLDLSFDGNFHHKEAVLQIAKGWNPYFSAPLTDGDVGPSAQWINYHCKSTWLIGSLIYGAFGHIEWGKAPHLLLIFAAYFLSVSLAQDVFKNTKYLSWIFGLVCALSPVAIYQAFTYYLDGQMASLMVCCFIFLFLIFKTESKLSYFGLLMTMILMGTIKSTGIVYAAVILGSTCLFSLFYYRGQFKRVFLSSIVIGVLSIIISYNPYVTSTIRYGSPIYPFNAKYTFSGITPPDSILYDHLPEKFKPMNRFEKLGYSLLSVSGFEEPILKVPFTVKHGEAGIFWNNDIKFGGFGPLFSGALLLSFLIFGLVAPSLSKRKNILLLIFPVGLIIFSTLVNPESHSARYAPQLYLLAVYALGLGLVFLSGKKKEILTILLAATLLINIGIVLENNLRHEIGLSYGLDEILRGLKGQSVAVEFGGFRALRSRLDEYGINYKEIPHERAKLLKGGIELDYKITIFKEIP